MTEIYLQYGCGSHAPDGWLNVDVSPRLFIERLPLFRFLYPKSKKIFPKNVRYGNILKKLPVPTNSCKGVYCSHVLEHLSLEDFRIALGNTYKILKPGGIFRFVLPDLEYLIECYISNSSSDAAVQFIRETGLGMEQRQKVSLKM